MPFDLDLSATLRTQGWRVKIQERERLEPPHVTIRRRMKTWRMDLRSGRFLDRQPPVREVPAALVEHIHARLAELRDAWDRMYPDNPVGEDR